MKDLFDIFSEPTYNRAYRTDDDTVPTFDFQESYDDIQELDLSTLDTTEIVDGDTDGE